MAIRESTRGGRQRTSRAHRPTGSRPTEEGASRSTPRKDDRPTIAPALESLCVPIESLERHPRNPRVGDVEAVAASLRRFGQQKPIVVQASTRYVVAGNHLLEAALRLGWTEIAANVVELDDATATAYMLAAFLATAVLGACASDNHPVIVIENRLSDPVAVVFLNSAGEESSLVETIAPGLAYSLEVFPTDHCTPGVLLARDQTTAAEIARSESPVCRPSRWIIQAPSGMFGASRAVGRAHVTSTDAD